MRDLHGAARLLVVDDNKVNRLLLARSLEIQGHNVATAENGRVALEQLRREAFDLVLLDMEMPEMDGFQVLEQLVRDTQLRDLPVIVTSSLEGIANVVRCIELGAEDYLAKPVNPVLLKARIGASLEKKRLRDQQKELVRRFATPEVAQDLQNSGFSLGGKRVHASVMFSDIRSFTTLAESQPPEETIELLNTYYALMFDAISSHGGVVTLMMGDGLMSVFGAPMPLAGPRRDGGARGAGNGRDDRAVQPRTGRGREAADHHRHRHRLRRDGGGYAGTNERATYTCIGDTVNLAARLETHTKVVQRAILIDQATRSALSERIAVEPLGRCRSGARRPRWRCFRSSRGRSASRRPAGACRAARGSHVIKFIRQRWLDFLYRHAWLTFVLMGLSFLLFGFYSVNLFVLLKANVELILQYGMMALGRRRSAAAGRTALRRLPKHAFLPRLQGLRAHPCRTAHAQAQVGELEGKRRARPLPER